MYYIISKKDSQGNFYYLSKRLISSIRSMDFGNKNLLEQVCWRKSNNFDNDFANALKLHDPDLTRSLSWNLSDRYPSLSIPKGITSPLDGETVNLLFIEVSFTVIDSGNYKEHAKRIAEGKLTDYELSLIMEDGGNDIEFGLPKSNDEPTGEESNDENEDETGELPEDDGNDEHDSEEPDETSDDSAESTDEEDGEEEPSSETT